MANKYFKAFTFFKGKVSPTIKSVKPTTLSVKDSLKKTKTNEYIKRINLRDSSQKKLKTGKELMKQGQKERRTLLDTGRAFQFKNTKSVHALKPGEKFSKDLVKGPRPQKRFSTGKELEQQKYFNKRKK